MNKDCQLQMRLTKEVKGHALELASLNESNMTELIEKVIELLYSNITGLRKLQSAFQEKHNFVIKLDQMIDLALNEMIQNNCKEE